MNNARRKRIEKIITALSVIPLEDYIGEVDELVQDEQQALDNMPQSLQNGDKGELAQTAVNNLDSLSQALGDLFNIVGEIEGEPWYTG